VNDVAFIKAAIALPKKPSPLAVVFMLKLVWFEVLAVWPLC
jgi:hypothetical protein